MLITPIGAGNIIGNGHYYRWQDVKLVSPINGYNFGGWSGDINGFEKEHVFEATKNLSIDASFIPIVSSKVSVREALESAIMHFIKWTI